MVFLQIYVIYIYDARKSGVLISLKMLFRRILWNVADVVASLF